MIKSVGSMDCVKLCQTMEQPVQNDKKRHLCLVEKLDVGAFFACKKTFANAPVNNSVVHHHISQEV